MKNNSFINNYNFNKIKTTHFKSPIVRNKTLKNISQNTNIYKNELKDNEFNSTINGNNNSISSRNNYKKIDGIQNFGKKYPNINRNLTSKNFFDKKNSRDKNIP